MKGFILIRQQDLIAQTWRIPFIGQGFLRNLSLAAYITNPVSDRILFHFGKDGGARMALPAVNIFDLLETSNDQNWNLILNVTQSDVLAANSKYTVVYAHRSRPLYVKFGDPLHLHIVGENAPDINFMVIRYEFIPYWKSSCAWGVFFKLTLEEAENYITKIIIPFSIREGLITYKATMVGSSSVVDSGYILPLFQKAGSQDEGQTLISSGRGVIDSTIDPLNEALGLGSVLQDVIPVNQAGLGGISQKTFSKRTPTTHEGATLSFDFIDLAGDITAVHLFVRIDFKVLLNKYSFLASYLEGTRVIQLNDDRLANI